MENMLDYMTTLIEIRKILRGRYIPGEKDHFDEEEYCMELNQAERKRQNLHRSMFNYRYERENDAMGK